VNLIKRILKSLAWGLGTKDIYYRGKYYHQHNGHAAPLVPVKAWHRDSYHAFMDDPRWWQRVAFKDGALIIVLLAVIVGILVLPLHY